MNTFNSTTIAAIATPPGDGGVSIIRLSGEGAVDIANQAFSRNISNFESHKLYYGSIVAEDQSVMDQGLLVVMRAPKSYTGETVVEFQGHGGHFLSKKILQYFCKLGAKLASPGEFTQRAYLNGKMDLAQAEAVQSLICAKNEYALKWSKEQLEGALSKKIQGFQDRLTELAAIVEAWVDFPEEGLEFMSFEELITQLQQLALSMQKLLNTYEDGQALQNGFTLCLVGRPNVGKSSLMNALLKKERALVTPIEGTTRDTIEETLLIDGVSYRLIDTAGMRQTQELVEQLGIERAKAKVKQADLVLLVLDSSEKLTEQDHWLLKETEQQKRLILWNKADLKQPLASLPKEEVQLKVSAKSREGFDELYAMLSKLLLGNVNLSEEIYLTHHRHKISLEKAYLAIQKVIKDLQSETSAEWVTFDLKESLRFLSEIIGFDLTENILSSIFSRFCVGK